MILEKLVVGPVEANCYIVGCAQTKEGLIIDPGADGEKILKNAKKNQLNIKYIINTHAHIDHIGANKYLKELLNAKICMHEEDVKFLKDPSLNLSDFAPPGSQDEFYPFPPVDIALHNDSRLNIGNLEATILYTPGHTPGGISVVIETCVFTGDTLFSGSIGNTNFPLSDYKTLTGAIKNKLLTLPDDFIVYPGHGSPTTIGKEKRENPYLQK
ncbi:MAG: MBL fold metallo-hydrolase [Candidatus Ratteibacteria bacterium]|nr:MBL fold metallo-hydrolase [Candidatus Ratteibacteria bacterium]